MIDIPDYEQLTKVTQQDLDEGVWDAEHKGLYSKDGKRFLQYMRPKNLEWLVPDTFKLKSGVKVICEKAFANGFFPFTSFIIPKSVVAIGDEAFQQMRLPQHANFTITKGLKYIGRSILGSYHGILNLIIEEGIKEIDLSYILNCAPAVTLYLPSTLESIGDNGLGEVDNTEHIHLAEGNKHFCLENGVLYNYDKTRLLRCPVTKRGELVIPEGVTTIGANAFRLSGYKYAIDAEPDPKLSVILPQSLTTIKKGAFQSTWMELLFIPANVSEIEEGAFDPSVHLKIEVSPDNEYFEVCNNLLIDKKRKRVLHAMGNRIKIPDGIMEIADYALYNVTAKRIVIPEGVTRVGMKNISLHTTRKISLPSTLKDISGDSFWGSVVEPPMIEISTGMGEILKEKLSDSNYYLSNFFQNRKNSVIYDSSDLLQISDDGKTVLGVYDQSISAIVIPYGIEVIGERAFGYCGFLREVVLPQTIKHIERCAFDKCKYLHYINLPLQLTEISDFVFSDCEFLESIDIPSGVERIDDFAFSGCSSLKRIKLPEGIKSIGDRSFSECNSLTSIKIPGSIKNLDKGSFYHCKRLKEIDLDEGVESVDCPFWGCTAVKTITIPNSLKTMKGDMFCDFTSLDTIVFAKDNPNFVFVDNVLYSKDKKRIVRAHPNIGPYYEVPKSVVRIDRLAFYNCKKLEEISLHDNIRNIGNHAFGCCKKLKRIVIPKKLKVIETHTFEDCVSLSEVVLQSGLKEIEWYAFYGCSSLHHIHIPESVRHINTHIASSLRDYSVSPDSKHFATIDGVLFNKNLTKLIEMPRGRKIRNYVIPDSVVEIGYDAFWLCKSLRHVTLPIGLRRIGKGAFGDCISLHEIQLPDGIDTILENTFRYCEALKSIKLPRHLKKIGEGAFFCCDSLKSLSLPLSVKMLDMNSLPMELKELHLAYKDPQKVAPGFYSQTFDQSDLILYVPKGLKEKYRKDDFWGRFEKIEEEP